MTSRVSWYKLTCNAVKRRLWYGALAAFLFFLVYPVNGMLRFQSKEETLRICQRNTTDLVRELENVQDQFQRFLGGGGLLPALAVAGAALLGAWSGLYWLHSRKKMDLLGSLPVRREKWFLTESLATMFLFAVPYVVNVIFALLVGTGKEIVTVKTCFAALVGIVLHLLFFAVFYVWACAAMLLTGKILTGVLGTMVLLLFIPAISWIFRVFPKAFWETYVAGEMPVRTILTYLSPAVSFVSVTGRMQGWLGVKDGELVILIPLLAMAAAGILMAIFCVWLVKRRPAEAAGNSMAFSGTEGIIKACILYPLSLAGGLFFLGLGQIQGTDSAEKGWFWFGLFFTLAVGSIIIEVIYHLDRRRILDHKVWTGIGALAAVATAAFFLFDLSGYDKWLPEDDEVEHVAVISNNMYYLYPDGVENTMEKRLNQINSRNALELAREGVQNLERTDGSRETYALVLFEMKNGSVKKRSYRVSEESFQKTTMEYLAEDAYREVYFPILLEKEDVILQSCSALGEEQAKADMNYKEREEFTAIYREELRQMDAEDLYTLRNGTLEFMNTDGTYLPGYYPINVNFKKSLAYLEQTDRSLVFSLEQADIREMTIQWIGDESSENWGDEMTVRDPDEISQMKENLISITDNLNVEGMYVKMEMLDDSIEVSVRYENTQGKETYCICRYLKDRVPEAAKTIADVLENR